MRVSRLQRVRLLLPAPRTSLRVTRDAQIPSQSLLRSPQQLFHSFRELLAKSKSQRLREALAVPMPWFADFPTLSRAPLPFPTRVRSAHNLQPGQQSTGVIEIS